MNRRQFLKAGAGAAALLAFRRNAYALYQSPGLQLWKTGLRGVADIPVAAPDGVAPLTGAVHYTIGIGQFTDQLHPDLGPTTLRGYHPANVLPGAYPAQRHLGGIIVAQKGVPIQITVRNNLPPGSHFIPVDTTLPGAEPGQAQNRVATHLHGGHVPWVADGGPLAWFGTDGTRGPSFLNNQVLKPDAAQNEAEYYYPNDQSGRLMWYHDHAIGITRINAYAGIASAYILRDAFEGNLRDAGLPDFLEAGGREIPIVIQDKTFVGPDIDAVDPTWPGLSTPGCLWYAHQYAAPLAKGGAPPAVSCVPEFFGDTMLANGTVYPEVTVEARRYRLRILNACQAKFVNLQLYVDDLTPNGITLDSRGIVLNAPARNAAALNPAGKPTSNWLMIGAEGGFLPNAVWVPMNAPINPATFNGSLLLAPAERADVIMDFSAHAGQNLILYTDAPAPFPEGDPLNDYFPGLHPAKNPVNGKTSPGFGPNTRVIMRFKVVPATSQDHPLSIARGTSLVSGIDPLLVPPGVAAIPPGVPVRQLTLNETFDQFGRLIQFLGTNVAVAPGVFGREYLTPATETPTAGSTEVWQIANLTGDTHPIHFHLVNVQVLSRQPFKVNQYNGTPAYSGPARPPDPNELGWKETVRMNPGEVATVIMRFDLVSGLPFTVPSAPGGGHEYVWHCHILEHEEHDMMRPLIVI